MTAVHIAAKMGNLEILQKLLEVGGNLNLLCQVTQNIILDELKVLVPTFGGRRESLHCIILLLETLQELNQVLKLWNGWWSMMWIPMSKMRSGYCLVMISYAHLLVLISP